MDTKAFVQQYHVRAEARMVDSNPHMTDMPEGSMHWRVTLRCGRRRMTVPFSQGPAICHEPTTEDVLDCLASDAASFESARSFEEWASDFGYDVDSRKAERIFKAVEVESRKLERFLGDHYHELLFETSRS